jgi:hypothetical protein
MHTGKSADQSEPTYEAVFQSGVWLCSQFTDGAPGGSDVGEVHFGVFAGEDEAVGPGTQSGGHSRVGVVRRGFATAFAGRDEQDVGESLQAGFATGAIAREDVFITMKLWNTNHRPERVEPAFDASGRHPALCLGQNPRIGLIAHIGPNDHCLIRKKLC